MYRLNDEQQRIAATAAAVAKRELAPRAAGVDRDAEFPTDSIAALGANGLLGLTVPKAHGGLGQPQERSTLPKSGSGSSIRCEVGSKENACRLRAPVLSMLSDSVPKLSGLSVQNWPVFPAYLTKRMPRSLDVFAIGNVLV